MIVSMRGIGKVYRTERVETHALSEINLEIRRGEFVAIAGPSGSGKSTLLAILGLLEGPTSGEYEFCGVSVSQLTKSRRGALRGREIGFVFQSFNLLEELTVRENVELPLYYSGLASSERQARAHDALEAVGLASRADHLPEQLSGGQQQRAAVARAIATRPALLLADEPTGSLDSTSGQEVMQLIQDTHRAGTTVCMVSHDPRYAGVAERVIELFDGRLSKSPRS